MNKFWEKVHNCKHKNMSPNYSGYIYCDNDGCVAVEYHCLVCGVYISKCQCGNETGMSGWQWKRWMDLWRKKYGSNV